MGKRIIIGIIVILALLIVPRQIWLAQMKGRVQRVYDRQTKSFCNIPCLDDLLAEMKQVNYELEHPPWYVVGGVGSVNIDK